jgi:hypothetical protein
MSDHKAQTRGCLANGGRVARRTNVALLVGQIHQGDGVFEAGPAYYLAAATAMVAAAQHVKVTHAMLAHGDTRIGNLTVRKECDRHPVHERNEDPLTIISWKECSPWLKPGHICLMAYPDRCGDPESILIAHSSAQRCIVSESYK